MASKNFFAELKRRNVYKVAVAYAIVGWLLVQIATQVFPFLEIPNWVVRLVIALVAIGFPIALIIAWAFELTPEGLKRTEDVDLQPSTRPPRKRAWVFVVIIAGVLSIGLFFLGRYTAHNTTRSAGRGGDSSAEIDRGAAVRKSKRRQGRRLFRRRHPGSDPDEAGEHRGLEGHFPHFDREIQKQTRRSEDRFAAARVANVLEGTVQKAGEKVRINVQLIDAHADNHLWAKTYDRDIQDIFGVESEVAQEIADSCKPGFRLPRRTRLRGRRQRTRRPMISSSKASSSSGSPTAISGRNRSDQAALWY